MPCPQPPTSPTTPVKHELSVPSEGLTRLPPLLGSFLSCLNNTCPPLPEPLSCTWDDGYVCDALLQSLSCRLRDINQKSLVLSGPHELQALHLNRQDASRQGKWHPFPLWLPGSLLTRHSLNQVAQ